MPAANDDKVKTARLLYQQIARELEESAQHPDVNVRMNRLDKLARIYSYVAEAPAERGGS